jgi:glycosyltransferase involved in cell wall biosynthesis
LRKVLIISYYFPPSGGPGVQRVLKFVKYLPDYGWQPVVLTVKDGDFPARDESLLSEIPEGVKVYRTEIFEPYRYYRKFLGLKPDKAIDVENIPKDTSKAGLKQKIVSFIRSNFFIPDARIGWKRYAVREGLKIIRDEKIKLIYTSSPPYTCALIGMKLKKITGVKWIAGFRDPWTGFLNTPKRYGPAKIIDRNLERAVMEKSDLIDAVCEGIKEDILSKYPQIHTDKIKIIPNGYDTDDFPESIPKIKNERFTITYTGSMYGVRNPDSFIKAMEELIKDNKITLNDIQINFVGRLSREITAKLKNSLLSERINIISYVNHRESVNYLLNSDALLLVIDNTKDISRIITGKVYEYLAAMKPVIAIGQKNSDIEKLLNETRAGRLASHDDINSIKEIILEYYGYYKSGVPYSDFNTEAINSYSRKRLTEKLSDMFSEVIVKN